MRLAIIACAALPLGAATAQAPPAPAPAPVASAAPATTFAQLDHGEQCPKPAIQPATRGDQPRIRNLGELPPADAYHAVYRLDGEGCIDPVMVGYQFDRRR